MHVGITFDQGDLSNREKQLLWAIIGIAVWNRNKIFEMQGLPPEKRDAEMKASFENLVQVMNAVVPDLNFRLSDKAPPGF